MSEPILAAMLSCSGLELTDREKFLFEKSNPLGVSLFGRNIHSPTQLKKLCNQIKECIGREDVLIAIDQEGGRVRRLCEPHFQSYASQYRLGQIAHNHSISQAKQAVKLHATLISQDLNKTGINWNYAPVIDIEHSATSPVLRSRTFGTDTSTISTLAQEMVQTYINYGISPCIKHLAGLGLSNLDPHLSLPRIDKTLSELSDEFLPAQHLRDCPAAMTAHILFSQIDNINPLTQSVTGIKEIIRTIIGFDGFLLSDAIEMHALKGSIGERTAATLKTDVDAVCYCAGNYNELEEVTSNAHFLRDKSLIRFEKIKNIIHNRKIINNYKKLSQQYQEIIGTIEEYDDTYDATETLHKMLNNKGE